MQFFPLYDESTRVLSSRSTSSTVSTPQAITSEVLLTIEDPLTPPPSARQPHRWPPNLYFPPHPRFRQGSPKIAPCAWSVRDLAHNAGITAARAASFQHLAICFDTSERSPASSPRQNAPSVEQFLRVRRRAISTLRRANARAQGENLPRNKKGFWVLGP